MRHSDIWRGIDQLADRRGLTRSGLAKLAGLDPTSFNPSKRATKDGRLRWPSTESVSRALDAVNASLDEFAALVEGRHHGSVAPLTGFAGAGAEEFFDEGGFPKGGAWEEVRFPGIEASEGIYALEITGSDMEPIYRDGDRIIVSPAASVRRGDRVVLKTRSGEVSAMTLGRETVSQTEFIPFNADHPPRQLPASEIAWIARILWVSQ